MMQWYPKLASLHRDDDTNSVIRLVANIFVVMTSLVFSLMINSAKYTFESIDANFDWYATSMIIFDRTLRDYGYAAQDSRNRLITYLERAIENRYRGDEESEGAIPGPLIGMLAAWLKLIFASFGYRAPRNSVVIGMFIILSLLITASGYLDLDMDVPFHGPIQISDDPLHRALAEMQL